MNSRVYGVLILFCLYWFFRWSNAVHEENSRFIISKGFLAYRTVSNYQKYCSSATAYSYSCCQSVFILYTKAEKNLCVNFTYRKEGLNLNVTLSSNVLQSRTVTAYKPLKFCLRVPGCLFSTACVNVLELNQFPRSITACLRLDIFSKKRLWQLNYDCISISTELPTMANNGTGGSSSTSTTMKAGASTSSQTTTTTTTMMVTRAETEETTRDVEIITVPGSTTIVDID